MKRKVLRHKKRSTVHRTGKDTSKRKAQIAVEYLFIVGIVLAATIFIVAKPVYEKASGESKIITAQRSVDLISRTADEVYILGPGNKKCVNIDIPSGVVSSQVIYGEASLSMESRGQVTDVVSLHKNPFVAGIMPMMPGSYDICIEQYEGGWGSLYLGGATCGAGDGCKLFCSTADSDCTDYSGSGFSGTFNSQSYSFNVPYCGNGVIEGVEQCETGVTCLSQGRGGKCNLRRCTCETTGFVPPFDIPPDPPGPTPGGGEVGPGGGVLGAGAPPGGGEPGSTPGGGEFSQQPPATYGNSIFDSTSEQCDPTANGGSNPDWQCRFSLNDHSNTHYQCVSGYCFTLQAGQTYIGDFNTIGITAQSDTINGYNVVAECNTLFDSYGCSGNRICTIDGRCADSADDPDKDGLKNNYETQGFYRGIVTMQNKADTDGDGVNDGVEILAGTNPLNAADIPPNVEWGDGTLTPNSALEQCDTANPVNTCQEHGSQLSCGGNSYCVNN